jgi:protein tyrosine phosphatase (PTP) superfamily phosphohydrolase (DUF442 family)
VPPQVREEKPTPALPADIPQFAQAKKGVYTGLQPFLGGVVWLKERGYKTVVQIRLPNETDTAAQRVFESRGIKYVSISVSPTTLTREVVERFNNVVKDEANHPLFVFDRDGSLAGALWYLHFRLVDNLPEDKARAEAVRLGFKEDQDGPHRTMWIAVQKYLAETKP